MQIFFKMRLFFKTSKLCLLTLLLMLVLGIFGQGDKQRTIFKRSLSEGNVEERHNNYAGKCGIRPLDNSYSIDPDYWKELLAGSLNNYSESRVVGGSNAVKGEFPWQAGVLIRNAVLYDCGAVIISEYWLLSAAHCFTLLPHNYKIRVGDYKQMVPEDSEQEFYVDQIFIRNDADIALLKIKRYGNNRGIEFSETVQPVCLPDSKTQFPVNKVCSVSGWGLTETGRGSMILQKAEVPIIDQRTCQQWHGNEITKNIICAGYAVGKPDSCRGDSGGPLVCKDKGVYTLCGIVSGGEYPPCTQPKQPGIYVRVTEFVSWIHNIIRKVSFNSAERAIPSKP